MYIVAVQVKVKPGAENIARWKAAITANHRGTRTEPGNVRFDVLKSAKPSEDAAVPVEYMLYEVYNTPDDFVAHQKTAHYLAFREAVADLMAEPRRPAFYESVAPEPWH